MFAHRFRPEHMDAVRHFFSPRKPRHPLVKLAFGLVGVAVLAVLVVVGLFVGIAMLAGGMLLRLLGNRGQPVARTDARVVDAEYRRVGKPALHKPALRGTNTALPSGR